MSASLKNTLFWFATIAISLLAIWAIQQGGRVQAIAVTLASILGLLASVHNYLNGERGYSFFYFVLFVLLNAVYYALIYL